MSFLHSWAIVLGAAAATLPVLIHWLTRPRPVRTPLSTIRFVQDSVKQKRARKRLRDWLILALRTLAVLAIALAIARPKFGEQPLVAPGQSGDAARVVILDVSQSMAAQLRGISSFERARPLAANYLNDQSGLQANLIVAGATPHPVFENLSKNCSALREELAKVSVRPERLNIQAAINAAAEQLVRVADGNRRVELVVISDFQRTNWASVDFSPLPEETRIQLESVAPTETPANLAILRVGAQGRPEQGHELVLEVEVGNYTPSTRRVQVEVALGDSIYRMEELCASGAKTTLSTSVALKVAGWQSGVARILDAHDALPADDSRPFVLEVRPPPTYALITRQPTDTKSSSTFYVERALAPATPRAGRTDARVVRVDADRVDRDSLAQADVLILDHPGRLAPPAIELISALVRRGRGLLYLAAEANDAINLKLLTEAAGNELQMPVEFQPPPPSSRRRDLFVTEFRREQPPFQVFGDSLEGIFSTLRFGGGLSSLRNQAGLADDILATYSDRSACLVISSWGAGTIAVLNADLAASNLPTSPPFVPFMAELVGRLHGRAQSADALPCGEIMSRDLPATFGPTAGLTVAGPDHRSESAGEIVYESSGALWRIPSPSLSGIYQVQRGGEVVYAFAAAVPAEECDLRVMDKDVFSGRLAGGRNIRFRSAGTGGEERDSAWVWFASAAAACLLAEMALLKLFGT